MFKVCSMLSAKARNACSAPYSNGKNFKNTFIIWIAPLLLSIFHTQKKNHLKSGSIPKEIPAICSKKSPH